MSASTGEPAPRPFDAVALESLFERCERPVFNVAYRWLWSRAEADDVTQEAFARLWGMRARVDLATVEPLLFRIAVNLASNRRRAKRLWGLVGLDAIASRESGAPGALESIEASERHAAVRRAIEALPEKQRRVVVLCELSGMSYREVAAALDVPEGTVASRRNTAMRALEAALSNEVRG